MVWDAETGIVDMKINGSQVSNMVVTRGVIRMWYKHGCDYSKGGVGSSPIREDTVVPKGQQVCVVIGL